MCKCSHITVVDICLTTHSKDFYYAFFKLGFNWFDHFCLTDAPNSHTAIFIYLFIFYMLERHQNGNMFSFRQSQNSVLSFTVKVTVDSLISCPSQFLFVLHFLGTHIWDVKKDCCTFIFLQICPKFCTSELAHWRGIRPSFFSGTSSVTGKVFLKWQPPSSFLEWCLGPLHLDTSLISMRFPWQWNSSHDVSTNDSNPNDPFFCILAFLILFLGMGGEAFFWCHTSWRRWLALPALLPIPTFCFWCCGSSPVFPWQESALSH